MPTGSAWSRLSTRSTSINASSRSSSCRSNATSLLSQVRGRRARRRPARVAAAARIRLHGIRAGSSGATSRSAPTGRGRSARWATRTSSWSICSATVCRPSSSSTNRCATGATAAKARFDRVRTMPTAPAGVRLSEPGVQLLDANGNGRADLMVSEGLRTGYYPLTSDGQWHERGFVRYRGAPTVNLDAPDVRLIDLDGDGVTDALRTGPQFELYYNDPEERLVESSSCATGSTTSLPERQLRRSARQAGGHDRRRPAGHRARPRRLGRVLALSRLRPLGPPRHHAQRAPVRGAAFFPGIGFDPRRLLVGDVDGDGVADLVYVSSGHITVWINQHGNALERSDRHSRHAAGHRRDGRAPRRHARHRHRGHALDLRLRRVPGQHLQVPGPDRRDQAVPARSDGQPHGRGDQGRLRAFDAVLPGGRRAPPRRAGARRCRSRCRWWRASRSSTRSRAASSRPSTAITTATGTGRSASSAASAWSSNSTPRRSRTTTRRRSMARDARVEPVAREALLAAHLSRDLVPPGAVDDDSGDWQELRLVGGLLAGRSAGAGAHADAIEASCTTLTDRATGAMRCGRCAAARSAPSSTPSTARTGRTGPTPSPSRLMACARNRRRNRAICRGRDLFPASAGPAHDAVGARRRADDAVHVHGRLRRVRSAAAAGDAWPCRVTATTATRRQPGRPIWERSSKAATRSATMRSGTW